MLIGGGLFVLIGPRRRDRKHHDKMQPPPAPEQPYKPLAPEDLEMPSSFDEQFEKTFGKPKQEQKNDAHGPHFTGSTDSSSQGHQYKKKHQSYNSNDTGYGEHYDDGYGNGYGDYGNGNTINKSAFIGDLYMGQEVFSLKPMNISAFIGDTVIDLTKAQIPYGGDEDCHFFIYWRCESICSRRYGSGCDGDDKFLHWRYVTVEPETRRIPE